MAGKSFVNVFGRVRRVKFRVEVCTLPLANLSIKPEATFIATIDNFNKLHDTRW
jgi:hypothetical protein